MVKMSDQVRSGYISSSHTRLIRCSTLHGWVHLVQASTDGLATSIKVSCHMHDMCSPMKLQTATSRIQLSHQHSLKLGSMCWNVSSMNSNPMDSTHSSA